MEAVHPRVGSPRLSNSVPPSSSSHGSHQSVEELELLSPAEYHIDDHEVYEESKLLEGQDGTHAATFDLEDWVPERYRRHAHLPISPRLRSTAYTLFVLLIPSFLNYFEAPKPAKKLSKTAWLDGLRGVSALAVLGHHSCLLWYPHLLRGWGVSPDDYHFIQLPIIRLAVSGPSNVAIFFVISGFSLSYKPLQLMRSSSFPEILDSLSSSVIRRLIRLAIPPAFVTFFSMLAAYFDLYGVGPDSRQPEMFPTFSEHFNCWVGSVIALSDPFRPRLFPGAYEPVYDLNLWTIPVELSSSMVIFTILLGVSKLRPAYRVGLLSSTVLYLSYYAYSHLFLFMSGVLLCEIYHIRSTNSTTMVLISDSSAPAPPPHKRSLTTILTTLFWSAWALLGLHVLSMPPLISYGAFSPGYRYLAAHIPANYQPSPYVQDTFWVFLAAVMLVFILGSVPLFQRPFTTRFAQYLGKVSFALYICHGTVLYTLGWGLSARLHAWLAEGGELGRGGYAVGVGLTGVVMYPLVFWVSDLVAMGVDAKSVEFARWVWLKASVKV